MRRAARLACAALLCGAAAAHAQALPDAQRVEFEGGEKLRLTGYAFTPPPAAVARVPGVIVLHGSEGISDGREGFWGRELSALGLVVLVVDSFTPRKVKDTIEDQTRVTTGQIMSDAFHALEFLATQNFIEPERIAVLGLSKGGGAALLAADRSVAASGRKFGAHVLLYPFCTSQYRSPQPSGPLLMLLGEADDWSGVKTCAGYAERLRKAGGNVELKTYKGAHHGFDGAGAVRRYEYAQSFRECVMLLEEGGRTVLEKTGELLDTPQKALAAMKRYCLRVGASAGASPAARKDALEDVKAFLKTTILK